MNNSDNIINLVLLERSPNEAERHISTLRNAGLVIHATLIGSAEQLQDELKQSQPDLILCTTDCQSPSFDQAFALCKSQSPDTPIIVIHAKIESDINLQAMRDGARDIISDDDDERLQLVVQREHKNLLILKELELLKSRLNETEARCTTLVEHSRDAIAYIHEGMHVHANPVYLQVFGYVDMEEIEGLPILDMIAQDDLQKFKKILKKLDGGGVPPEPIELSCRNGEGNIFAATLEFTSASIDDEPCTQIIIRNRVLNDELEKKIRFLTSQDPQTGLANRQHFLQQLEDLLTTDGESESESIDLSLFYLSVSNFHQLRSEIGIAKSDSLIKEIGEQLQSVTDESQLLARFGDHTFALIGTDISRKAAKTQAENLISAIQTHPFATLGDVHPICHIGVLTTQGTLKNSQEYINQAYNACEAARSKGEGGYSFFNQKEMEASYGEGGTANEVEIDDLIQYALENDRFKLVFQPVVSLHGDSRENYAVLTRLIDKNDEEIHPGHFLNETTSMEHLVAIDQWVIGNAMKQLSKERLDGRKTSFLINLSAGTLQDEGTLLLIVDTLREHNVKAPWVCFQISDKDLRAHPQETKKLFDGLAKLKCMLAIDQFGSEQNPEGLLKNLSLTFVKFDANYLSDLASNQEKQDQLNQLNKMAHAHGVKTIAMGIEDANSLAVLWTVGADYIQGYFLQEPSENISYEFSSG
ncbi:MAG: EAL domain-containing protein [Gammaproteobacteria bacterium]|nr:EAL domain-containing protein [Gammaproteobacteria bacterium]